MYMHVYLRKVDFNFCTGVFYVGENSIALKLTPVCNGVFIKSTTTLDIALTDRNALADMMYYKIYFDPACNYFF